MRGEDRTPAGARPRTAAAGSGLPAEWYLRAARVNYRILYFFYGQAAVVLSHGLTKKEEVPTGEVEAAIIRKKKFQSDPEKHTYKET